VGDEFEGLVRRSPVKGRDVTLSVRIMSDSLAAIDRYAARRKLTRADATRSLLRSGLKAEGEIR
jgi:hypothetical protein